MIVYFRNDYEKNWEKGNPLLKFNEVIVVITKDGLKFKKGNAIDKYLDLPFISLEKCFNDACVYSKEGTIVHINLTKDEVLNNAN